jgi:hypothetical protein
VLLVPAYMIEKMTGCTQPAAQHRHLRSLGLPAWRNALGEVCLTVTAVEQWCGPLAPEHGQPIQGQNKVPQLKPLRASV